MKFTKYNGLGNDFVFLDTAEATSVKDPSALAIAMCNRRTGIGADGLILLLPTDKGDVRMRIINSDGSEAEMCGNASRCVALHWLQNGFATKKQITLDTLAGPIITEVVDEAKGWVRVDMGSPRLMRGQIPMTGDPNQRAIAAPVQAAGETFIGTAVSMGNPHFVIFVEDISKTPLEKWGPALEVSPDFPRKTNVEFVQVLDKHTVRMRVWERGAGITQACGTGSCATAVACVLNGYTDSTVTVKLDGGDLRIEWPEQGHVFMTGPAKKVFTGDYIL